MSVIVRNEPLGVPWAGTDPFLLCGHHQDLFPAASSGQGVAAEALSDRPIGNDFTGKGGFNMYYGTSVPGFPAHPHRGFETVTVALEGVIDHTDSMGAAARYGDGDVQWLTAGSGILHCEMFPLRRAEAPNPLDFYQIWLNLPASRKMTAPAFKILWGSSIPVYRSENDEGALAEVRIIAGVYAPQELAQAALVPPEPTPDSWAADPANDVAIWEIRLEQGATLTLPPASGPDTRRTLYFHQGETIELDKTKIGPGRMIEVIADHLLALRNIGGAMARIMLLQGVPIDEPVVAHGPFVMNSHQEIVQAKRDFTRTRFGGWPWPTSDPVHSVGEDRFARYHGHSEIDLPPDLQEVSKAGRYAQRLLHGIISPPDR